MLIAIENIISLQNIFNSYNYIMAESRCSNLTNDELIFYLKYSIFK